MSGARLTVHIECVTINRRLRSKYVQEGSRERHVVARELPRLDSGIGFGRHVVWSYRARIEESDRGIFDRQVSILGSFTRDRNARYE